MQRRPERLPFEDDSLPENQVYQIYKFKAAESSGPLKPWGFELPTASEAPIKIEGMIDTNYSDTLSLEPFNKKESNLLYDINYTVLDYEFHKAIVSEEARWIRLKFKGEKAAKISVHAKYIFLRRLTNSLAYLYQISGPQEVKEDFIHGLNVGSRQNDNSSKVFKKLIEFFKSEGVISNPERHADSVTSFKNIFINIDPRGVEIDQLHLINTRYEDITKRIGDFPDVIVSKQQYKDVYRWGGNDESPFSFRFRAKPINLFYLFMPYIGAALAATGVYFALYNITRLMHH